MNIFDFKSHIDKVILERGYDYYLDGRVTEAFELRKNEYVFHIEGSEDYQVEIEVKDNGDIIYSVCDCPYDFGPVCKHEAASYFELFNMLNQAAVKGKVAEKPSQHIALHDVLAVLSKEDLIKIIIDIADGDTALKNSLLVRYLNGDKQQELEACRTLIRAIVRKYTGREGFIKYRDTGDFVFELEEVLEKARNTEDVVLGVDIALLLLEESIEAFQYADDSNGDIGFLVTETLGVIGEVVQKSKLDKQKDVLFTKLLDYTGYKVFDGWEDFQLELLHICFVFADDVSFRVPLKTKIESMLDANTSDRLKDYMNENLLQLLFKFIEQYGTDKEAEQFISEHLQYSSFRELLLNKYIQEKNYNKVIEVAKGGEVQDKKYPGLITRWKKFRYSAYQALSLKEEQQGLAMELFLNGDFNYYGDLKELAGDQDELYASLKHELKSRKGWQITGLFQQLIEQENDLEEILVFVRRNPQYIETYAEKLSDEYKQEVIEIYREYIKSAANAASNRKAYQRVCKKIN
ncbi:hypothetical protein [Bacillus sp. FJAT-27251]|uniref:SWIM zinc finger family protein n=1 Tax=Bacillus sp. FJAT-27251 TaxID=1684142 RepID=UPI0006A79119|nr:hypothetical protein [Bacillus sp. FJAT-27251]